MVKQAKEKGFWSKDLIKAPSFLRAKKKHSHLFKKTDACNKYIDNKTYNAYTLVYIGRYIKKLLIMVRLKQVYNTVQ